MVEETHPSDAYAYTSECIDTIQELERSIQRRGEEQQYESVNVPSLLNHLNTKFNRLLNYMKEQETEKLRIEDDLKQAKEYMHYQAGQLMNVRKEASQTQYERDQLMQALTALRKKVQEKVPVISVVEERRLELE